MRPDLYAHIYCRWRELHSQPNGNLHKNCCAKLRGKIPTVKSVARRASANTAIIDSRERPSQNDCKNCVWAKGGPSDPLETFGGTHFLPSPRPSAHPGPSDLAETWTKAALKKRGKLTIVCKLVLTSIVNLQCCCSKIVARLEF